MGALRTLWNLGIGYNYKTLLVDNSTNSNTLTNYPVRLNLTSSNFDFSKSKTNGEDLFFLDSDKITPLQFYIESFNKVSQLGVVWIKLPSIPANSSKVIYLRYGTNSSVSSSNGYNTFDFFDDFTGITNLPLAPNAASAIVTGTGSGYLGENIVFDSVTNKYWIIFENRSTSPTNIKMASADTLDGVWTVETNPVIIESGHSLTSPCIAKFDNTWYIYYGRCDSTTSPQDIWVQKSSSINTGYSQTGISNPILSRGSTGTWDENRALEPYVFKEGNTYYMFYMGESVSPFYEKTGYATSSSPDSGWAKYANNPVLYNSSPYTWNAGYDQAADPFVFKVGDVFYVGACGCPAGKVNWQTGFWTTKDFITFTPVPGNPILKRSVSGFDKDAVFRGAVTNFNGTLYYSYSGLSGSAYSIGLTQLTFSTDYVLNPDWIKTGGSSSISGGVLTVNSGTLSGLFTFGQGYAIRTRVNLPATGTTYLGFRSGSANIAEYLVNYLENGTIKPVNNKTTNNIGSSMGSSGSWVVADIKRNANTSVLYSLNDGTEVSLNTEVPDASQPVMFNTPIQSDWVYIRKYSNPEPSVTIS